MKGRSSDMRWIPRIQILLGVWVLVSPWLVGYASITPALWSGVMSGAAIAVLGLWGAFGEGTPQ